jgi:hypothetical protein
MSDVSEHYQTDTRCRGAQFVGTYNNADWEEFHGCCYVSLDNFITRHFWNCTLVSRIRELHAYELEFGSCSWHAIIRLVRNVRAFLYCS